MHFIINSLIKHFHCIWFVFDIYILLGLELNKNLEVILQNFWLMFT